MQATVSVVGMVALALLGFVLFGGPPILVEWVRKRRQKEIVRQIALTDALDGLFGALVTPVVTKPLFGPWEIQLALPLHQYAMVARILSVVAEVFRDVERVGSRPYRIFLSGQSDSLRGTRTPRVSRSVERWAGGSATA